MTGLVASLAARNITQSSQPRAGTFGTLWIEVGAGGPWNPSTVINQNFMQSLLDQAWAGHVPVGVLSSQKRWLAVLGNWTGASHLPLW